MRTGKRELPSLKDSSLGSHTKTYIKATEQTPPYQLSLGDVGKAATVSHIYYLALENSPGISNPTIPGKCHTPNVTGVHSVEQAYG